MKPLPIWQVDAFASRLFAGNPAAVVRCDRELPAAMMQAVAAENNLSETAFLIPEEGGLRIRWFTPTVEVDLCGHATLAAAHVLFEHLGHPGDTVAFSSRSGTLRVRRDGPLLWLDFPADATRAAAAPPGLVSGLGVQPREIRRGRDDFLALLDDEEAVAALRPEMALLAQVPARGVIVTAPGREVDFVSRFFAPQSGVPEDPVTGSAHTTLAPYWAARTGRRELTARQVSRRGGDLLCHDRGDRVEIGGRAVTYLVGEILLAGEAGVGTTQVER